MPMFVAKTANAEVNGETVYSIIDGMGAFKSKALEILAKNGIKDPKPGMWFSQQSWLNAFKEIATVLGPNTLFTIGQKIPENAQFPPQINSVDSALGAIDVAFHMNHRINGKVLFDPATGKMQEGIGHYQFEKVNPKEAKMTCPNSYPCDFDRGIIEGMAKRFKPVGSFVQVIHNDSAPCRKKGAESCEYRVKW
jgi:hypothetical protein